MQVRAITRTGQIWEEPSLKKAKKIGLIKSSATLADAEIVVEGGKKIAVFR